MSDFLTNLALKSSYAAGRKEVLQPRVPSWFEPRQGTLSLGGESGFTPDEQNRADETIREVGSPPTFSRRLPVDSATASHSAAKQERVDPKTVVHGSESHADSPIVKSGGPPQPVPRQAFAAPVTARLEPAPPVSKLSEEGRSRPEEREDDHAQDGARTRRAADQPDTVRAQKSLREPDGKPANPPHFQQTVQAAHTAQDDVARLVRSLMPRAEAPSGRRLDNAIASANSSQPTVHVTIGRIELRAATQPTPPQKDRTAGTAMSLEEYLKQRRNSA